MDYYKKNQIKLFQVWIQWKFAQLYDRYGKKNMLWHNMQNANYTVYYTKALFSNTEIKH